MEYREHYWVLFQEGCTVCSIAMGGHHHMAGEEGCECYDSKDRYGYPNKKIVLSFAGSRQKIEEHLTEHIKRNEMSWAVEYYNLNPGSGTTRQERDRAKWILNSKSNFTPYDGDSFEEEETYKMNHGESGYYFEILCAVGSEYMCEHTANLVNGYAPERAKEDAKETMLSNYAFNQNHWKMIGKRGER